MSGRALTADGAAVAGVRAFLVKDHQAVASAATGADGSFELAADVIGPAGVLINDGRGKGALKQFALYQGHNDAGDLYLQPLDSIAPVVDLHGVGFEERATRDRGNYRWPVFNSNASAAYAMRKLGGEDSYEIVEIALPSGSERVLMSGEQIGYSPLELLADRVLHYSGYRPCTIDGQQYSCESNVLLDVVSGQELLSMPWWEVRSWPFAADGQIYFFRGVERREAYDTLFGPVYAYQVRPARLDPETGELTMGPVPGFGWVTQLNAFVHGNGRVAFVPAHDCDPASDPECSFNVAQALYTTDLATLVTRHVASLSATISSSPIWFTENGWDGSALFTAQGYDYQTNTQKILRIDIDSGAISTLRTLDCTIDGCLNYGKALAAPDRSTLLALLSRYQENQPTADRALVKIDPFDGALTTLDTEQSVAGVDFTLCGDDYPSCDLACGAGGSVEVQQIVPAEVGQRFGAVVEYAADGSSRARLFAIGESDGVPTIVRRSDGAGEAVLLRDLTSGFMQIAVGAAGSEPGDLLQLTFITADHHDLVYAPTGDYLYYFTRDPISGYEQLFRIAARGLADAPM
ncbi:MAG: hypothetical protein JXR83_22115 [Deltaproteobacteria bacterium]|nr:hypothetical protein [Deltaproteobacteria bacterium]